MGCAQSLTVDDEPSVILIKPKTLKFKSHNSTIETILKKQFTDKSGQTFYIIPSERASFSKVPVLSGPDSNSLVLRRKQSKLNSSPLKLCKADTSAN